MESQDDEVFFLQVDFQKKKKWKKKGRLVLTYLSRFRTPQDTRTVTKPPNRQAENQGFLIVPLHFKFGHSAKHWASNKIKKSVHQFVPRDYHPIRKE